MRVVIIGSGLGGLATGIRLAARGHKVSIFEQRDQAGGRGYVYRQDGFTFDGGPTVITAPWMIEELFTLAGRDVADAIQMVPIDPFYRIFFHDGAAFDYSGDQARMETEIRRLTGSDADIEGYRRFLAMSERIFDKGFTDLADKPFLHVGDMAKVAPALVQLQSYRTVYSLVSRYVHDNRLRQILTFHPLLVGGNPFQTTSIYSLIQHLERHWGVWFAMGGTGVLIAALVRLFEELGGTLECNATVASIRTTGRRATGVTLLDGREIDADIVVSNADVATTYMKLLKGSTRRWNADWRYRRTTYSMSLVVIYFGTDRQYRGTDGPALAHHDIILGPRYKGLLDEVFRTGTLADDFSLYLHCPTLTDPTLAPPGCDTFYVLAPVPHLGTTDWRVAAMPYRDRIMQFLEERYLPDLQHHIVTEHMIDPRHFQDTLGSYLGSAFSVEPLLTQSAWFRPHNRSQDVDNLYIVGAGTHPGAGIPGVLSSAKIADDLITQAFQR